MIEETYCSFEVAKLLKEKGFPMREHSMMYTNKNNVCLIESAMRQHLSREDYLHFEDFFIQTVTCQMAMAWLREEYDLHIIAYPWNANGKKKWCCQVYKTFNLLGCEKYVNETLDSYEEAIEAALKYTLENLI